MSLITDLCIHTIVGMADVSGRSPDSSVQYPLMPHLNLAHYQHEISCADFNRFIERGRYGAEEMEPTVCVTCRHDSESHRRAECGRAGCVCDKWVPR